MIATLCYGFGLICRGLALLIALRIMHLNRSWRFVLLGLGVAWIMLQPVFRFIFTDSGIFAETQSPGIFLLTSAFALFFVYQLMRILELQFDQDQLRSNFIEIKTKRQAALLELASKPSASLIAGFSRIATVSAKELELTRVGIWLYDETRSSISAAALYKDGEVSHTSTRLFRCDYPDYFQFLETHGWINAYDARKDPATSELSEPYLTPEKIYSMLDVPIRLDGKVIGIICHEATERYRHWSEEDQEFAHSLADLCALQIAADKREQIERKLRESQRHLQDAQNAGQFASFRWEPVSDELVCSGKIAEAIGYQEGSQTNTRSILQHLVTPDGERLVEKLTEAFENQEAFRFRVQTNEELGSRHFELRAEFTPESKQIPAVFEGTIQDITDQILVERENQRLEGQLIQSQKMESIGTMAGGIAHDFNNILTPILGYTDVMKSEIAPDSPLQGPLNEILSSSLRARDLIQQILMFGRRFDETLEPLDMQEIIDSALKIMKHTLPASIRIEVDIEPGHQPVEADSTQMIQVVVNLCTNAWHAMQAHGGTLTIGLRAGAQAATVLSIKDTGVGITEDAKQRIFEPFYTTKKVGEGTGLGLSMVHGIVSKLGGKIDVLSKPGQGSEFLISLPTTDQLPALPQDATTTTVTESGSILVVDDDEAVAGILKSMLTDLGYDAEVHLDGQSALENFRLHPTHYDMVVTDLTMPNMSGMELCDKIRLIEPEIPVFILTGYSKEMVHDQLADRQHCHVVGKPLVRADLATALAKELH